MIVEKDDFVLLEYTAKADGVLFDTTSKKEAEDANAFNPRARYGPLLVAVGRRQVIAGLEEALVGAETGQEKTVTLSPEKAFGPRIPDLVRLVPLQTFRGQNLDPVPGMVLELDGRPARIQSVSGGRVRVDFNSDLAGKTVEYRFIVKNISRSLSDKVTALGKDAGFPATFAQGSVLVTLSGTEKSATELAVKKLRFLNACFHLVDGMKNVRFDETYTHDEHG